MFTVDNFNLFSVGEAGKKDEDIEGKTVIKAFLPFLRLEHMELLVQDESKSRD